MAPALDADVTRWFFKGRIVREWDAGSQAHPRFAMVYSL